jgi:hypothetical protein
MLDSSTRPYKIRLAAGLALNGEIDIFLATRVYWRGTIAAAAAKASKKIGIKARFCA